LIATGAITFGSNSILDINGYGQGSAVIIILTGSNVTAGANVTLTGINNVKYEMTKTAQQISLRAKSAPSVNTQSVLESAPFSQLGSGIDIATDFSVTTDKVIYGNGKSLKGSGTVGIELDGADKTLEINDASIENFGAAQAIKVTNGKLVIAANNSEVKFSNNKKDLDLAAATVVNVEARKNNTLTFKGEVLSAANSTINKNGNSTVIFEGDVNLNGELVINQGIAKVTTASVHINELKINSGGTYSTMNTTTTVVQADIYGTIEMGLSGDLINVTGTLFVSPTSIWQMQSFGASVVEGAQIKILQAGNTQEIIGLNYQGTFASNGNTVRYVVYDTNSPTGEKSFSALNDPYGIWVRILGITYGGVGMSARFIANSIRAGAINNDEVIFANADKNVWVSGGFSGQNLKDSDDADAFISDGFGAKAGVKVLGGQYEALGIFAGFDNKTFKQGLDQGKSGEFDFGIYGLIANGQFTFKANAGLGFQDVALENKEQGAKADFETTSIRFGAEADYDGGTLKPFVGLQGGYVLSPKISEKIDGQTTATIAENSYLRFSLLAGLKVENDSPRSNVNWYGKVYFGSLLAGDKPEYKVTPNAENSLTQTATGSQEQNLFFGLGAGLKFALSKNTFLNVGLDMNFAGQGTGYLGNVGLGYKFSAPKKKKVKVKKVTVKQQRQRVIRRGR
jgi:hypothetical protein